jgi:cytochrome d ubiquinol oxidase subunit II
MPELSTIWFVLVGVLLAGYAILDGFDLGVGMLHFVVARDADERRTLMRTIGPVWDGNEVWLLTMGGALFAAFPPVYATVFSGFYLALMLLLVALIFRAVALEFRSHVDDARWRMAWDVAFSVGSALPALLLGVAIGNVAEGIPLTVGTYVGPLSADGGYTGGLIGLLNPFALLMGALAVALFVLQGANWLMVRTVGVLRERARRVAMVAWPAVGVLWLAVTFASRAAAPHLWENFGSPIAWVAPIAVALALAGVALAVVRGAASLAFGASSIGVAALVGILGIGLYPTLLPDANGGVGLTVSNASSSDLTLTVMLVIALIGVPLVLAYTAWIYRHFWGPVEPDHEGGY